MMREPQHNTIAPSAARTTHPAAGFSFYTKGHRRVTLDIDVVSVTGTSITFTVQQYDEGKADWVNVIATAAKTGAAHTVVNIGPEATAATDAAATGNSIAGLQRVLPRRMRVLPSGTITSATYSIVAHLA